MLQRFFLLQRYASRRSGQRERTVGRLWRKGLTSAGRKTTTGVRWKKTATRFTSSQRTRSTIAEEKASKIASDGGTFLAGIGGILCAGIALQQYYMAKSQTECTATLELLKVRCAPEIQGGFDKIVSFQKKMKAKAKLKHHGEGGKNDYADRFAAALWFSHNVSALNEVFDSDGDHRLTREEMALGLNAFGCSDHLSNLLTVYFFEDQGDDVDLASRCTELKPQWDEADDIDKAALCLRGLFHKLRALIDLKMMSIKQAAEVPDRRFTRGFIRYVEPLIQAKHIRLYDDPWDRNRGNCLFQFCRQLYDIDDIPEPHHRENLAFLVPAPADKL